MIETNSHLHLHLHLHLLRRYLTQPQTHTVFNSLLSLSQSLFTVELPFVTAAINRSSPATISHFSFFQLLSAYLTHPPSASPQPRGVKLAVIPCYIELDSLCGSSFFEKHRDRLHAPLLKAVVDVASLCTLRMDNIVDSLTTAHQEFISAAASTLEAKENSGGQKTPATDAALENFKQRWELFRVACDQAEEFVESVKQRIGSECLVDEATGSVAPKPGQPAPSGLPPISAVRLEQMSKAVRWLVIGLQQGSGAGGGMSHPNSAAPFDARFTEDPAQ